MSITRVQGQATSSTATVTTLTATLSAGITNGNLVVAAVACGNNATTFTGPAGWTQVIINQPAGTNAIIETSIWYLVVGAGQAGQTSWTWNLSASHSTFICISEWSASHGWPVNPVDQSAVGDTAGTPTTGTALTSGTTATTTQGEELWIASLAYKGSAQTETGITAGWTNDLEGTLSGANTMFMLYKVASATGAASCSATIGTAQYWAGCVVTFIDNLNPTLATSPASLSFSAALAGANPASQNDTLSETAGLATAWTSAITYSSGSGWLAISPTSGSLLASGTATIAVSCTTGALGVGTYNGTVTFTATTGGATATISVSFTITGPTLSTSPTSLSFMVPAGGGNPASQNDTLSETSGVATAWTSAITYGVSSGWLALSPISGSLLASGTAPISVSCTTGGLSAGIYTATITFTATTGGATATIAVSFQVPKISPTSQGDLSFYKEQQVLVFKPNGTFIDIWRDAPLLAGLKDTISAATAPIQVALPRSFDNFDLLGLANNRGSIGQGNVVQYWIYGPGLPNNGLLKFQGIIDAYAPQIAENGEETVVVSITPYSAVLGDHGIAGTLNFGTSGNSATYVDVVSMFNYFFQNTDPITGVSYTSPLTLAAGNPASSGYKVQYTFQNQTLLSMWQTMLQMLPPAWFFRVNPNKTVTFMQAPSTAQHTFNIGQHIVNPQYTQDWTLLRNVVYVTGATANSKTITALAIGSDITIYGERLLLFNDSRITDQTTAQAIAQGLLNIYDRPTLRTKIRVPDYRGDIRTALGYDIETLAVGDTVQLLDTISAPSQSSSESLWDVSLWGGASGPPLWDFSLGYGVISQLVQIMSIDYNFHYVDLELGTLQPNQDRALFQIQQQFSDFTMFQSGGG